jgi:hypothetical protein
MTQRKFIQIAACAYTYPVDDSPCSSFVTKQVQHTNEVCYGLCDDGTVWFMRNSEGWVPLGSAPQRSLRL